MAVRPIIISIMLLIFLTNSSDCSGQNLVQNGDFENFDSCINWSVDIPYIKNLSPPITSSILKNWEIYIGLGLYNNSCFTNIYDVICSNYRIPAARTGQGNALIAFRYVATDTDNSISAIHNFQLTTPLSCALQAGCVYKIQFYVRPWVHRTWPPVINCFTANPDVFIDRIGLYLSTGYINPVHTIGYGTPSVPNYTPHILSPSGTIINDTSDWTLISGTYVATGGEDRITIGSFDTSIITNNQFYPGNLNQETIYFAMYQVDDVSIIPVNNLPPVNLGNDTTVCRGQPFSKTLDAGPGHAPYLWSTGETTQTITVTQPGTYWVNGSGECTCSQDTITIFEEDPLSRTLGNDTALCPSAFPYTIIPVIPLTNYLWSTGAATPTLTVAQPGTYWLETNTVCGAFRDSIVISYQPFPVLLDIGKDTAICSGDSIVLRGDSHFTAYLWNTGAATDSIVVSAQGWYTLSATDDCGTQTDSIYVTTMPLSPPPVAKDTSLCKDDPAPLISVQGTDLKWYAGLSDDHGAASQPPVSTSLPGIFYLFVTQNTNGCESPKAEIKITVLPPDTIIRTETRLSCIANGFSMLLQPAGGPGIFYEWNTGDSTQTLRVHDTGSYWRHTRIGCDHILDTIHVAYRPPVPLVVSNDTAICPGTSVTLYGNGGFDTYRWNTGAATESITVSSGGYYTLTVTDFCGTQKDSVYVTMLPRSLPPVTADTIICRYAPSPSLSVNGNNLLWYTAITGSQGSRLQPVIPTGRPGKQTLYVTQNTNSCESEKAGITVEVLAPPEISLPADTLICQGTTGTIGFPEAAALLYRYIWNTGETTASITPGEEGRYTVTATNECGADTASIQVAIEGCTDCLYAPTAFTPNNDGKNDLFRIGIRCPVHRYLLRIYNRWGEMVYETTDPQQGWDGRYRGHLSDAGSYFYIVNYQLSPLTTAIMHKGDLTLVR